eukprot:TRINITY_DN27329_c0_g1_i1.p1 TRINITY_DN27329_c0_g1~~TRINITY_DN27329_c0_g1_i1.p1  ORF type:complete len:446 (+),score=98.38 TRINITY_DN27329_c0_g1_i1:117-1340(+)
MARAALDGLSFPERKKKYIAEVLDPILEDLVKALLRERPPDPASFLIHRLRERSGLPPAPVSVQQHNLDMKKMIKSCSSTLGELAQSESPKKLRFEDGSGDDDDSGDEVALESLVPPKIRSGPRQGISAESTHQLSNGQKAFCPPVYPKPADKTECLRQILQKSFLFSSLARADMDSVIAALKEVVFEAGSRILCQGEIGSFLFVIESGTASAKKLINGVNKVVKTCGPGDVFGELALLYSCPRAATVDATERCVCWQLDRETFNAIVKEASSKRVQQHMAFLEKVSLFQSLDNAQRNQLIDALKPETYGRNEYVMRQGDAGSTFYIVEEGTLAALKESPNGSVARVKDYAVGDYFGELALLRSQPRAASVIVTSAEAKVLSMDRKSFSTMLGPLADVLRRAAHEYK